MSAKYNKVLKQDFIDAFMINYRSSGDKVPFEREAYGKPYTVIENRANYKVIAGGVTKRFSNLYAVGSFIYDMNFDPKKTYIAPLTPAKQFKLDKLHIRLDEYRYAHQEPYFLQNSA